jgi:hypothetical protein
MSLLAATGGGVDLPTGTWIAFGTKMLAGVATFSALGYAIALLARPCSRSPPSTAPRSSPRPVGRQPPDDDTPTRGGGVTTLVSLSGDGAA